MFEKKKSFRHGSATFPLPSTNSSFQYFAVLLYHFSGSKTPWLMNKFCLLRFSISFPMLSFFFKFDALTARKLIFKQHMKYVGVFYSKLTKF